jgi:hypothetical protein
VTMSSKRRGLRPKSGWYLAASLVLLGLALSSLAGCGPSQPREIVSVTPDEVRADIIPQEGQATSYGVPLSLANVQGFIDYYNAAQLTPVQERIKRVALTALKAPCCDDNTMNEC